MNRHCYLYKGSLQKKSATFFTLGGDGGQDRSSLHFFFLRLPLYNNVCSLQLEMIKEVYWIFTLDFALYCVSLVWLGFGLDRYYWQNISFLNRSKDFLTGLRWVSARLRNEFSWNFAHFLLLEHEVNHSSELLLGKHHSVHLFQAVCKHIISGNVP